ncbi:MAG: CoA ester lyase [Pseudomonadota bacterium]
MKYPLISLYVPGNRLDLIEKAPRFKPDAVILDLEDAVPAALKESVRLQLAKIIPSYPLPVLVRVNSEEEHLANDIRCVAVKGLHGIILPMVETAAQVQHAAELLASAEAESGLAIGSIKILLLIETPLGVINCFAACTASERVESVVFGSAEDGDMQAGLNCAFSSEGYEMMYARSKCLLDARAAKLPYVLDGAFSAVKDLDALKVDCTVSRRLGYDGRTLIYPGHVTVARHVYAPSAEDIAYYKSLVQVFDQALASGQAAIVFNDKLIDYAMYKKACKFLANAAMYVGESA